MALTLSGDGTIVGLAAGGLSDLSVATADIADAAITAAKMSGAQSGDAPAYVARAWVNFNGTGTVAIRASGNVSSITDNGTGDYTVNFTTAMPDANYTTIGTGGNATDNMIVVSQNRAADVPTTTAVRVKTMYANTTFYDVAYVGVAIFR